MRFVIFGAGAVGGVIGGRLFEHGHEVVLIARGAHGQAIATDGLTLESADGAAALRIPVVERADEITFGNHDVVVLATKSQDTSPALEALAATAPPTIAVVCAQNGVENERLALRSFANVYGMCVMLPATHLVPGLVQANSTPVSGLLDVGRYPSGVDGTADDISAALAASTFSSIPRPDVMRWKYCKLLMNLGNAIEAVCGLMAQSSPLFERAKQEGTACLRAAGIDFASDEEDRARRGSLMQVRPIGGARRGGGSSWQSLARGVGSIETAFLTGEIVMLGRLWGVPTPVNEAVQQYATRMARTGAPPGSVPVAELLSAAGLTDAPG